MFSTPIHPDKILLRKNFSLSSLVTAFITQGKSIYYYLSELSNYQNILILTYGSLHTLFSVPRCNFYMFSEGLRLCISSQTYNLQTEGNLNIWCPNHRRNCIPILPTLKTWGKRPSLPFVFHFFWVPLNFFLSLFKICLDSITVILLNSCHSSQNIIPYWDYCISLQTG